MKISKKFTTVTPLSKFIAMALFITLPFFGLYLGIKYQEKSHRIDDFPITQNTKEIYPECIAYLCPTFTSTTLTDTNFEDTVIKIPTAMTQGTGKIVIVENGKKIFDSGEKPSIGFEQLSEGNGFILKYSSALDENFKRENYEIKYIWKDGKFTHIP